MKKSKRSQNRLDAEARYRKSAKGKTKRLMHYYGITYEQYSAMLGQQSGRCAICKSVPSKRNLAVDHCHATGKVRALLCASCNKGLGHFSDIPEILEAAVAYLKSYGN